MFRLGAYGEHDAKSIADHLRDAGIRVELRPCIDAIMETSDFLQGRFSELKVAIKDETLIKNHERYLDALKRMQPEKLSPEIFDESYLKELFPSLEEKRKLIQELLGNTPGESKEENVPPGRSGADTLEQTTDEIAHSPAPEKSAASPVDSGPDTLRQVLYEFYELMAEGSKAETFARSVLSLNDIEPGEEVGKRLDDPVVMIPVDSDAYGSDHPNAKRVITVYLRRCFDLFVDEFSVVCSDMPDEEFVRHYTDENIKLGSLRLLFNDLMDNHSSDKMDMGAFEEECFYETESGKRALKVFGYSAASEIAKVLEKNGLIKIKGDMIRWRK